MSIRYDDKGKFFTEVVSKEDIPAIIQTNTTLIYGKMCVRPNERLKDELNRPERFLAVTDVRVFDLEGTLLYSTDFMAVNRSQVVWVIPQNDLRDQTIDLGEDS